MVVFLCISGAALLILFRKVIVLLLGPSYRSAESIIPFLTLMPIFAMMFEITNQSIKFAKKGKYLNIASLVAIAVNIGGNTLLVPAFGGLGAAITTGISYIVYFAIGSYYAEKCIRVGYNYKKTAIYAALIVLYCAEASFINNALYDTMCGMILLIIIGVMERKQLIRILEYVKGFLVKK